MRSDDTVNSVESHAEYEESAAQSRCPKYCGSDGAEPMLIGRELQPVYAVQIRQHSYKSNTQENT